MHDYMNLFQINMCKKLSMNWKRTNMLKIAATVIFYII